MKMAYDILWDITDEEGINDGIEIDLPNAVKIPNDINEEEIGDWLSDTYGFCHYGFTITEVE